MASTLQQQISVEKLSSDLFTSCFNPGRMGNTKNIAYGGCAVGVGIEAASQTVSPNYVLYSAMGNYLGPAITERKLMCSIRRVRDTRTFATRVVEIGQEQHDGVTRLCMIMVVDFQVKEKDSLLVYSATPQTRYSPVEKCLDTSETIRGMVSKGEVTEELAEVFRVQFDLLGRFFECRGTPEGVISNNLNGLAKGTKTPQDGMDLTSKTSADWFRCSHPLEMRCSHYAGLGFIMDGALSFLPLAHNAMFLDDAGACSSLEFAFRLFDTDLDLTRWHLREMKTVTGGNGRTYSESRLWDSEGNMVANMTQQSILRPLNHKRKAAL
ncbi:hypothetical protein ACCO45_010073 [Purpureocillium lilacinum]|uniref:Uncharacterized protein n=2 Tax=Purpureocillium lilacinum TaxID=33203 RepID=A0ACC4DDR5_PURLI|nr:hypothetical protein Purlil1_8863 [Purpureocillium lilacinum]